MVLALFALLSAPAVDVLPSRQVQLDMALLPTVQGARLRLDIPVTPERAFVDVGTQPESHMSIRTPLILYSTMAVVDLAVTEYGLAHGGRELNPLMRTRGGRLAMKAVVSGGLVWADVWLQQREGRRARILRGAAIVVSAVALGWNVHQSSR